MRKNFLNNFRLRITFLRNCRSQNHLFEILNVVEFDQMSKQAISHFREGERARQKEIEKAGATYRASEREIYKIE